MRIKINATTPLMFYRMKTGYVKGKGVEAGYELLQSEFAGQEVSVFWAEWRGAFGTEWQQTFGAHITDAQATGIRDLATIRMPFNPVLYEALRGSQVMVIKNADKTAIKNGIPQEDHPNVFSLFGNVDNIKEEDKLLEFHVRRYEQK